MTKPIIRIHDVSTNEVIDREMTDVEFETYQEQLIKNAQEIAEAQAKAQAKAALLARLGITEEEAQLLLGNN